MKNNEAERKNCALSEVLNSQMLKQVFFFINEANFYLINVYKKLILLKITFA